MIIQERWWSWFFIWYLVVFYEFMKVNPSHHTGIFVTGREIRIAFGPFILTHILYSGITEGHFCRHDYGGRTDRIGDMIGTKISTSLRYVFADTYANGERTSNVRARSDAVFSTTGKSKLNGSFGSRTVRIHSRP
jgi:hypothetical protein